MGRNHSITTKAKRGLSSLADHFGYEIRRKSALSHQYHLSQFESCLHVLTNTFEKLNIVQIGANDGAINDPLHRFIQNYPSRTQVILCEPQEYLIPVLKNNYGFHNSTYISNCAVGPRSTLTLYRIKQSAWRDFDVPYAKDWPLYRAPTGVTSTSYEHVSSWVSRYYTGRLRSHDVIETVTVPCSGITEILCASKLADTVQVIQVDAEGFDDEVIYSCEIEKYRPLLLNFECANLPSLRADALNAFLRRHGYVLSQNGLDCLAILVNGIPNSSLHSQIAL